MTTMIYPPLFHSLTMMTTMAQNPHAPETIQSLDVFLNAMKVGTIIRTPGDFNAFRFDQNAR